MNWQKLTIINRHDLKLAGLLLTKSTAREPGRPPLVIVCHGFTGGKEGGGGAQAMGEALARRGFDTLLFDFTGCGESAGTWEEITLTRQVEDLEAAVTLARQRGYRRIILNGRSFGGATVLAYAALDPRISGVCTWAAVGRPLKLFRALTGPRLGPHGRPDDRITLADSGGSVRLRRRFFRDLQGYNLLARVAQVRAPLLLIHGTADTVVPPEDARLLLQAANEPKKLIPVTGGDHQFSNHRPLVWEHFFSWLESLAL